MKINFLVIFLFAHSSYLLRAAPGDLDSTFGISGKTSVTGVESFDCVSRQADGKILAGGTQAGNFALVRFTTSGALDSTFGTGGKVITDIAGFNDQISGVAVQTDGKIVAAGYSSDPSSGLIDVALARYNTNGTLDTTFGTGGKVITNFSDDDKAIDVALQSDGRIVIAGLARIGGNYSFLVARYNAGGSLDTAFGSAGRVTTAVGGVGSSANRLAIQPDGKIVVVGNAGTNSLGIVRYLSTGALDNGFSDDGIAGAGITYGEGLALQADGKILVTGLGGNFQNQFGIARFLSDGSLDWSFGYQGHVYTSVGTTSTVAREILFRNDWKIVVVGFATNGNNADFALAQYHPNGSLDSGFGTGGKVSVSMSSGNDYGVAAILQTDGKIIVAGSAFVARFDGGGNTNFSPPAVVTTEPNSLNTTSATINGMVNPSGVAATAFFEYGVTAAYGSTASVTLIPDTGTSNVVATANLVGLTPGTMYHYRLVANNVGGTALTADATFTTLTPAPEIGIFAGLTISSPSLFDGQTAAVDYGTTLLGVPIARSFTVRNTGTGDLLLSGLTLPDGFELAGGGALTATVPPSSTLTFDVIFLANAVHGRFTGIFSVLNNDSNESSFDIPLQAFAMGAGGGSKDLTFGTSGIVATDLSGTNDQGHDVAVQSDGKIVMAGYSRVGTTDDFAVLRYLPGGGLDTSFGTGGRVTTSFGTSTDRGYSVALQSDGKILVAGSARIGGNDDFAIVRYLVDGSLDTSFGSGGKQTVAIGISTDIAFATSVQGDGKIVLAGYAWNGFNSDFALARCNSDGTLDTGFGTGGKVITSIGASDEFCRSLAIQQDGRIVTAGHAHMGTAGNNFAIVRYDANGSLDTTFAGTGKITMDIAGNSSDSAYGLVVQSDGKIVAAGETNSAFALVRCLTNGSLDPGFGTNGIASVSAAASTQHLRGDVVIEPGGKLLVAGYCYINSNYDVALMRCNADGSLDAGFGDNGRVITPIGTSSDYITSIALKAGGEIVLGGFFTNGTNTDFALLQFMGGEQVYPSPSVSTQAATNVTETSAALNGTLNPNGILTSGWFEYGTSASYGSITPLQPHGYGNTAIGVTSVVSGLTTGVTYHYRLVAENGETIAYGEDVTFTPDSGGGAQLAFNTAMAAAGLTGPDSEADAIPFDDGVENLLKYAFNMNLAGPDASTMASGGNGGLPVISQQGDGPSGIFRFEFVERIGSGLIYTPKKSTSLNGAEWIPLTDTPSFEFIDTNWRRVIYEEPSDPANVPTCFGIIEVTLQ